jgi:hypothetical protein
LIAHSTRNRAFSAITSPPAPIAPTPGISPSFSVTIKSHIPIPTTSTLIDSEPSDIHASSVTIDDITKKSNRLNHFRPDLNAPYLSEFMQLGQIDKKIDHSHQRVPSAVHREFAEWASHSSLKFRVIIS